ncbi:MAG: 6-bladed beta-propeller [Gemmatimonadota bacterium]|nr:6-bladed beta-propeller [Gemmatimonadota bacterium]MDE2865580.1 6-bladed beta-propeller [Gemmatimonadota bacterium]
MYHYPAALLALVLGGGEGTVPDTVVSVTDSAGVRITMSAVSDGGSGNVCPLAETPDVRLASPASGEWTLFRVEDLDRMDDGRLVVLNRGSQELFVFSRDGEFLQSFGRQGEGPGEFIDPIEFDFVAGDSIIVWDWGLGRVVLFGPDLSHERSVMVEPPVLNPTGRMGVLGREAIALGSNDRRRLETQLTPQFLQVLRYDWSGRLIDTLATLPNGERGWVDRESRMVSGPLFDSRGVFATRADVLYTSDGRSPEVRIHRGSRLESIVRWEPGDLSVRKEDVEAYRTDYLAPRPGDSELASRLRGSLNPVQLRRKRLDVLPVKDRFPAVTEIQIDDQDRMWIRAFTRPTATATEWLGFTATGAFMCSLSVPKALTVFRFDSSAVVAVHRDEADVESVEVRSFRVPPTTRK